VQQLIGTTLESVIVTFYGL